MEQQFKQDPYDNVDNLLVDAYVWFEPSWQHEKKLHTHKYYQLTYVEDGYQYFYIGNKVYFVPQNYVILIPSGTLHRTTSEAKSVILKAILFKNLPDEPFYHGVRVFSAPRVLKEMLSYASKWNKLQTNDAEQTAFLKAIVTSLPYFYQANDSLEIPVPKDDRLAEVCHYINTNYRYNIITDQLADIAKMSSRNLQRIFKRETGITLKKYLQVIRILKSIELLNTNQYTLTEIAYKVGYKSLSAFTNSYFTIMKHAPKKGV